MVFLLLDITISNRKFPLAGSSKCFKNVKQGRNNTLKKNQKGHFKQQNVVFLISYTHTHTNHTKNKTKSLIYTHANTLGFHPHTKEENLIGT